jgi:manganese transport protein
MQPRDESLPEAFRTVQIPRRSSLMRKVLAYMGPGFLISVGYMDPGNWATDLEGGARYGYRLLWVVLLSNLMAILLQTLCVRLGLATGQDLAQACRQHFRKPAAIALWILCEIAIVACDLAEVIGSAIALQLLFGIPLIAGVAITTFDVLILLGL